MFHLTPQEKHVLSWFLAVCLAGTLLYYAANCDARPLRWINTVGNYQPKKKPVVHKPKPKKPRKGRTHV